MRNKGSDECGNGSKARFWIEKLFRQDVEAPWRMAPHILRKAFSFTILELIPDSTRQKIHNGLYFSHFEKKGSDVQNYNVQVAKLARIEV